MIYYCVGKLIDTVLSVHLVASECVCLLPFEANQSYNIHFSKAVLLTNAYCVHFFYNFYFVLFGYSRFLKMITRNIHFLDSFSESVWPCFV